MPPAMPPGSGGEELIELAERSTVGVFAPARKRDRSKPGTEEKLELIGSGFFVTPDRVLTCAHVVRGEPELYLAHGAETLRVEDVELVDPQHDGDDSWPVPDLALLRVAPADTDTRPPVWLDLAPNRRLLSDAGYLSLGYDERGPGGVPGLASRPYHPGGTRSVKGVPGLPDFRFVEITGDAVPKYRSGSMVVDLTTGRVMGIVKAARAGNDGVGGYVVPLAGVLPTVLARRLDLPRAMDILADHDTFHAQQPDWPALCEAHFAAPLRNDTSAAGRDAAAKSPLREADLLGLLARVRHVVTPAEVFEIVQSHVGLPVPFDGGLRDVALALSATATPSSTSIHSLLRFVEDLTTRLRHRAGATWLSDARRWTDDLAAALNQTPRLRALRNQNQALRRAATATPSGHSFLQVRVDPALGPRGGYHISVRLYRDTIVGAVDLPEETIGSANVLAHLRDILPQAVRIAADVDSACLVDFVLPKDLLAEPVHRWEARGATPIGRLLPVAVRAVERYWDREDDGPASRLRDIWSRSADGSVSLHWILCQDPDIGAQAGGSTGLGLVNPPSNRHRRSQRLLESAVDSGLPLLVWSASDCGVDHTDPQSANQQCAGPFFQTAAESALRGAKLREVPHRLFARRGGAGAGDLDPVALFWDNPELSHEPNMLTEPCYPEDP